MALLGFLFYFYFFSSYVAIARYRPKEDSLLGENYLRFLIKFCVILRRERMRMRNREVILI